MGSTSILRERSTLSLTIDDIVTVDLSAARSVGVLAGSMDAVQYAGKDVDRALKLLPFHLEVLDCAETCKSRYQSVIHRTVASKIREDLYTTTVHDNARAARLYAQNICVCAHAWLSNAIVISCDEGFFRTFAQSIRDLGYSLEYLTALRECASPRRLKILAQKVDDFSTMPGMRLCRSISRASRSIFARPSSCRPPRNIAAVSAAFCDILDGNDYRRCDKTTIVKSGVSSAGPAMPIMKADQVKTTKQYCSAASESTDMALAELSVDAASNANLANLTNFEPKYHYLPVKRSPRTVTTRPPLPMEENMVLLGSKNVAQSATDSNAFMSALETMAGQSRIISTPRGADTRDERRHRPLDLILF